MRKWYTLKQLKESGYVPDLDTIHSLSVGHQQLISDLRPYILGITIVYGCIHEDDGKLNIYCSKVSFERDGLSYTAQHKHKYGYLIYVDTDHLPNISRYDEDKAKNGLEMPSQMHKITQKKVDELIKFQADHYRRLKEISDQNTLNIELLLKKVRSVPEGRIDENQEGGEILRNGLRFSFKIDAGYIETKIEVNLGWQDQTFENFMDLSENKYMK